MLTTARRPALRASRASDAGWRSLWSDSIGIDAALALADLGHEVLVVDEDGPWQFRGPDPSQVLSPYTSQRLREALGHDAPIALEDGIRVERVDVEEETFEVIGTDGALFATRNRPVLATGFESGLGHVNDHFEFESGQPQLTERDESTTTSGLFLAFYNEERPHMSLILSDTSDATAPVAVWAPSRRISPNVDEHVHVLVSDSINWDELETPAAAFDGLLPSPIDDLTIHSQPR
jgi:hypothetical protein